jgi:hypothetical protein
MRHKLRVVALEYGDHICLPFCLTLTDRSDVLIYEDWVAVRAYQHRTDGASCTLVCLVHERHTLRLQLAMQFAHIDEGIQLLGITAPAAL